MGAEASKMLRDAVKAGDLEKVNKIIAKCNKHDERALDLHEGDKTGLTPLIAAATGGHTEIVRALIAAGVDVNKRYSLQNHPRLPNAQKLMPTSSNGATALSEAARKGHIGVVSVLSKAGADPNVWNMDGKRPIHRAVIAENVGLVNELIACGADLATADNFGSSVGKTPMEYALLGVRSEIVLNLHKQGMVPPPHFKGPSAPHVCQPLFDAGYSRREDGSFMRATGEEPF